MITSTTFPKMKINMNNMIDTIINNNSHKEDTINNNNTAIHLINQFTNLDCDKALVGFIDIMGMAKLMTCGKGLHTSSLSCINERYTKRSMVGASNKKKKMKITPSISKIEELVPTYIRRHLHTFVKTEDNFRAIVERTCVLCEKSCFVDLSVYGLLAHGKCLKKVSVNVTSVGISKSMVPYLNLPHVFQKHDSGGSGCITVLDTVLESFLENNNGEIENARRMVDLENERQISVWKQDRLGYIKELESCVSMKFYKWKKTISKEFSRSAAIWASPQECIQGLEIANGVQNPLRLQYGLSVGRRELLTVNKFCNQMITWDRLSSN